jgi:hypothetical protein
MGPLLAGIRRSSLVKVTFFLLVIASQCHAWSPSWPTINRVRSSNQLSLHACVNNEDEVGKARKQPLSDQELPWISQGMLLSSFTDGLLPNQEAQAALQKGLIRAMLTQLQRATEQTIVQSVEYSPCAGPNVQALGLLELIDRSLEQLDNDNHHGDPLELLSRVQDASPKVTVTPFALRFVYIPTAMYALRMDSTNSPGKQRQRARADGKARRNAIIELLRQLLPTIVDIHAITLDWDDGSVKQPEGTDTPKTAHDAMTTWQPHLVYVQGGNTFWLHHCLHKTPEYRQDLIDFCTNNNCGYYMGTSAGAIVVGAHVQTACWKGWDDPRVVPGMETYQDWDDTNGLQLVGPYSFFPHMEDHWDDVVNDMSQHLPSNVICLRDGDVCVVDGRTRSTKILQAPIKVAEMVVN